MISLKERLLRGNQRDMKIKTVRTDYQTALSMAENWHKPPQRPNFLLRKVMTLASAGELRKTHFKSNRIGMERLATNEPCLILMNHSSFIDLKIAATVFADRPFNIVCTSDGLVGKSFLMRKLGCIPTNKFITDLILVRDMIYALHTLKNSVLLYPEASYSFDGTATPLPDSLGKCIKLLKVPVIMVKTYGAFQRDPLYNNLQPRQVDVSADIEYVLSPEEIADKSVKEINTIIGEKFTFDNFKWQQKNQICIKETFRADYLNRVLYKCPECGTEGAMEGRGVTLKCRKCQKEYILTEDGYLQAKEGVTKYAHVPDWYRWQRKCVEEELEAETYQMECEVEIGMMVNLRSIYLVGSGVLRHDKNGFELNGCEGALHYCQKPSESYSLYADYYWYELGDVICIGNSHILYYCFPKEKGFPVSKARLAAEEMYKRRMQEG